MSLADDVAHTQRIVALQDGPTILVGHSFAGTVITQAGVDPQVVGLVYVAARAPDAGEDYGALAKRFPTPPTNAGLVFRDGFGGLTGKAFLNDFANGVGPVKARALYAVQGRVSETRFGERTTVAAWKSMPSWYAVSPGSDYLARASALLGPTDASHDDRDRLRSPLDDHPAR